ncbi:MAG TPA: uroporphyrinogen-III synthase [Burkholderiales bacterium]|nr:uroporphyrinogen-III synthase [Burkholderiales bacterium]
MKPLAGKRIVVTRPRDQAAGLSARIRGAGGEPLEYPAMEIRELDDPAPFFAAADRLASFDVAIFVSRNAVRRAVALLGSRPWPARLRVATVGVGSRQELEALGFSGVIAPAARSDSEALLALPELANVAGRRFVIFRGDSGRQVLGDALAARGASVEYVACYRRVRPGSGEALRGGWAGGVDAVTVSSAEGLANFIDMLGDGAASRLSAIPVFVPHARVAEDAARRGLGRLVVAGPRDADMLAALVAYFGGAG